MAGTPPSNASGIAIDSASHERVVPQSVRADGSVRRERKVKPGYTPIEDVPRFRSQRVEAKKAQTGAPRGNAVRAALGLEDPRSSSPASSDAPPSPRRPGHAPLPHSRADSAPRWEHDAYADRPPSSYSSRHAPSPQSSPVRRIVDTPERSPDKNRSPEKSGPAQKTRLADKDRSPDKTRVVEKGRLPGKTGYPEKTRSPEKPAAPSVQRSPVASPGSAGSKYAPAARAADLEPSPLSPSPRRSTQGDSSGSSHRRNRGRGRHGAQASATSGSSPSVPEAALPSPSSSTLNPGSSPLSKQTPLSLSAWAGGTFDWAGEDEDGLFGAGNFKIPGVSGSIHALPPQATDKDKDKSESDADGLSSALGKMNVA